MKRYRALLSFAWAPVLSGCIAMGGMGHMAGMGGMGSPGSMGGTDSTGAVNVMGTAGSGHGIQVHIDSVHTEASSGDLRIALSFPLPSSAATVPITVRLRAEGRNHELADAEVWLKILVPEGRLDEIRMHHAPASAAGAFQARYSFPAPGPYVVTAEGHVGTEAGAGAVSVGTKIEIGGRPQRAGTHGGQAHGRQQSLLAPAPIVSGLTWA